MVLKDPSSCCMENWTYVARVEWGYQSGGRFISPQGIRESILVRMVTDEVMKSAQFYGCCWIGSGIKGK